MTEEIRIDGKFSSGSFWKLVKRMKNKTEEPPHAVESKEGEILTETEQIVNRYGEYYEDLLTTTNKRTKLPENKEVVTQVDKKFAEILRKAKEQIPKKTDQEMMEKIVSGLKKGKARDSEDWNNEMIINGGNEMVRSLVLMADEVKEKLEIPKQWQSMKSAHKKEVKEKLTNKRGLFLTNIISKVFKKLLDNETSGRYDAGQNGGRKRKGTLDNWIILGAQINEGRRLNKAVYIFFVDLVKCFDRLWLRDCIVDLNKCGMKESEVAMVYELNKEARFRVDTPSGLTEEVKVKEIVKQGIVFGPKLCCASTGEINQGLHRQLLYPEVTVQAITFMDDINAGGE